MKVEVKRLTWGQLADREVHVRTNPFVFEWPKNFGSIQYTPDALLLPGSKYIAFQIMLLRGLMDTGIEIDFPEYEQCKKEISTWGSDSLWLRPDTIRKAFNRLFEERFKYVADLNPHRLATIITLHNSGAFTPQKGTHLKKNIEAMDDNKPGANLLFLYRNENVQPVFDEVMITEPMAMLYCRQLAFKDEIDAILHQELVIVDEHETSARR